MTHANEGRARFNLVIGDGFWTKLVKPFWLIAFGAIVQTVVIVYLAFYQPLPKIDEKLLTVHNALLDVGCPHGQFGRADGSGSAENAQTDRRHGPGHRDD